MSRLTDIADEVWEYSTRTTDGNAAGASDGTRLDDIAYAVWTYSTRTVDSSGVELEGTVSATSTAVGAL